MDMTRAQLQASPNVKEKTGKKASTTQRDNGFPRLPWHLEPADKKRLMDQLDERIRGLADEIHECHLTLVLDMQIEIERLWAGKTKDPLVISFGEDGGKFNGIVEA